MCMPAPSTFLGSLLLRLCAISEVCKEIQQFFFRLQELCILVITGAVIELIQQLEYQGAVAGTDCGEDDGTDFVRVPFDTVLQSSHRETGFLAGHKGR